MGVTRCTVCGSNRIEHRYPIWLPANDWTPETMSRAALLSFLQENIDHGAEPWEDSDCTFCSECAEQGRDPNVIAQYGEEG